jgi:hypothetical protein
MEQKKMETQGTALEVKMSELIGEYGITATTSALINLIRRRGNWRQMDTLKSVITENNL